MNASESLVNKINKFKTITTLIMVILYLRGQNNSLSQTQTVYKDKRQVVERPQSQHRLLDQLATLLVRDREVVAVAAGMQRSANVSLVVSVSHQRDIDASIECAEDQVMHNCIITTNPTHPNEARGKTDLAAKTKTTGTKTKTTGTGAEKGKKVLKSEVQAKVEKRVRLETESQVRTRTTAATDEAMTTRSISSEARTGATEPSRGKMNRSVAMKGKSETNEEDRGQDVVQFTKAMLNEQKNMKFDEHVSEVIELLKKEDTTPYSLGVHVVSRGYRKMRSRLRCTISTAFLSKILNAEPDRLPELFKKKSTLRKERDQVLSGELIARWWGIDLFGVEHGGLELKTRAQNNDVLFVKETCVAFHHTLCLALKGYQTCLDEISKAQPDNFGAMMNKTWLYVTLLEAFAYSNAFADYLTLAIPDIFDHPFAGTEPKYTTPSRESQGQPNTWEEQAVVDDDDTDMFVTVGSTPIDAYKQWLRRQVVIPFAVHGLVGSAQYLQNITYTVISAEHPGTDMAPWEEVVKEVLSENDETARTKTVIDELKLLMTRDAEKAGSSISRHCKNLLSPTPMFQGSIHCECLLASVLDGKNLDNGSMLLAAHGVNPSDIDPCYVGTSKLACPVCHFVNSELGARKWLAKPNHNFMFPCALPRELREDIHTRAEIHFKAILLDLLDVLLKPKPRHSRTDSAQTEGYQTDSERKSLEVLKAKREIDRHNVSVDRALWIN